MEAFREVRVEADSAGESGAEFNVQSIENKGAGVFVVRVAVPENVDKEALHRDLTEKYERQLTLQEAKYKELLSEKDKELYGMDKEIEGYRRENTNLLKLVDGRKLDITLIAEGGKAVSNSRNFTGANHGNLSMGDNSSAGNRSVRVRGNVVGSTINLGEISGQVSQVIQQVPDSLQGADELRAKLKELQQKIEEDDQLEDKKREMALRHLETLAHSAQNPSDPATKIEAENAKRWFEQALPFVNAGTVLVQATQALLPVIWALIFPV